MKKIVIFVCCLLSFTCFSYASAAEILPAKKADIEKLLRISGTLNIAEMFANAASSQIFEAIKLARPDIPPGLFDVVNEETKKVINENVGQLIDFMTPIYDRHLTHEEVKGLTKFYESALGQKAIKVMPVMAQEGLQAGQQWGESLWPILEQRIIARIEKEGLPEPANTPLEPIH